MSTTVAVNTVIVGAGQAGLSVSHFLKKLSVDHLVLEQADLPGEAWRNHRWDSFTLNTPRWQSRLPGDRFGGDDADGFMPKEEIVSRFEKLARPLPVRYGARVVAIERDSASGTYVVEIDGGKKITARNVVVATGLHQTPKIPALSRDFPSHINQLHSDSYRNPEKLPPGAVLVVGSAQSGAQIAEELYESGRKAFLAVGRAGRTPRRYRGKDANWWIDRLGHYDRKVGELPSPKAKFSGKPHISGTKGGHTINLHQFAHDGVTLLGRLAGSGAASSRSPAICTTIWRRPTAPKRSWSRRWMPMSPKPEWWCPKKRCRPSPMVSRNRSRPSSIWKLQGSPT
jgi:putative flavoprotein involved in K+ transport